MIHARKAIGSFMVTVSIFAAGGLLVAACALVGYWLGPVYAVGLLVFVGVWAVVYCAMVEYG